MTGSRRSGRGRGRLRGDHRPRRPHLAEREQLRLGEQQRHAQDRRGIRRLRGGDLRGAPAVEEAHEPRLLRGEPELLHPHARDDARGGAVRPGSEPSLRARGVDGADRGAGHRVRVAERERRGRRRHARLPAPAPRLDRERAADERGAVIREQGGDVGRRDEPLGQERADELAACRGARALGADELLGRERDAPDEEPAEVVLRRDRGGVLDGAAAERERVPRRPRRDREPPVRGVRGGEQEQPQRAVRREGPLAGEPRGDRGGGGDLGRRESVRGAPRRRRAGGAGGGVGGAARSGRGR